MSDFKIELRGMTLEEVCRAYPEQVAAAIERHAKDHSHSSVNYSFIHKSVVEIESLFPQGTTAHQHHEIARICQNIAHNEHDAINKAEECPPPSPIEKEEKRCQCTLCKRNDKYESILKKYDLSEDDQRFMDEILVILLNVETDLEVAECKLHGEWPGYEKFATA